MSATPVEGKAKFPAAVALDVARELCGHLVPVTERLIVAGSLRRRKAAVGDVEILFVPKTARQKKDLLETEEASLAEKVIAALEAAGILERRLNKAGRSAYGEKNKLMRHRRSGVPVDLFTATAGNWFNYLVCRTGPAESNIRICEAAQARGWKWNPYGAGFSRGGPLAGENEEVPMMSERAVFEFVGLPYLQPWDR